MTDDEKTGGPAFPQSETLHEDGATLVREAHGGMTKRDWFAGQALVAMGTWHPPGDYVDQYGMPLQTHTRQYQAILRQLRAEWAYAQADAMIAAGKP
jgi:hypothetical protein